MFARDAKRLAIHAAEHLAEKEAPGRVAARKIIIEKIQECSLKGHRCIFFPYGGKLDNLSDQMYLQRLGYTVSHTNGGGTKVSW